MDVTPFLTMISRKKRFLQHGVFFLFSQRQLRIFSRLPFTRPADARLPACNDSLCQGVTRLGSLGHFEWPPKAQRQAPSFERARVRAPDQQLGLQARHHKHRPQLRHRGRRRAESQRCVESPVMTQDKFAIDRLNVGGKSRKPVHHLTLSVLRSNR